MIEMVPWMGVLACVRAQMGNRKDAVVLFASSNKGKAMDALDGIKVMR